MEKTAFNLYAIYLCLFLIFKANVSLALGSVKLFLEFDTHALSHVNKHILLFTQWKKVLVILPLPVPGR